MKTSLYRLGRFSYRHRWLTTGLWVLVLVLLGFGAATLSRPTTETLSIPGTESWRAMDVVAAKFGGGIFGGGIKDASAKVVFTLDGPGQKEAVAATVAALRAAPQVTAVTDPYEAQTIAPDGRTAYATVSYSVPASEVTAASRSALLAAGRSGPLGVEFSGEVTQEDGATDPAEGLGILVAAVVLLVTFGSFAAAGLPLLTAIAGVAAGLLGIAIASGFLDLTSNTSDLATMLGLAVGIDYALFVLSRYRQELAAGQDGEEAAGRAVSTAGSAVVLAGSTVIISLAALSVVGIPFLAAMGLAAAGTVAVAVLISLSLLPALLGLAGGRLRHPRAALGERWGRWVVRHRVPALVLAVIAAGVVALPAFGLRLALPDDGSAPLSTTQRKAYDQLAAGFGDGINGPLLVVIEGGRAEGERARRLISGLEDVVLVTAPQTDPAGTTTMLSVVPRTGPTSPKTKALVYAIRAEHFAVTGRTAIDIDIARKIGRALPIYLAVVIGLALVLLTLVFRSVLVPVKAVLGFLLSVGASFGALVVVFQRDQPIVSFIPIFLVGVLFGLAMDYEVFLVTLTREEYAGGASPDEAVVGGLRNGARVVTAAALIMMSVFAGFVLGDDPVVKSLGFALAFGVGVDAFLVRMTIVPAVLSLLGRAAWWLPGRPVTQSARR